MVKLVDTPDSGSGAGCGMEVQVLFRADSLILYNFTGLKSFSLKSRVSRFSGVWHHWNRPFFIPRSRTSVEMITTDSYYGDNRTDFSTVSLME